LLVSYGTPAWADRTLRAAAVDSDDANHFGGTTPGSLNEIDRSLLWPASPLEAILAQGPSSPSELDARIEKLKQKQSEISMTGPRATAIVGGVLTGAGGFFALITAFACGQANQSGYDCDTSGANEFYIIGGSIAAVGLVTLTAGLTTLIQRSAARCKIDREIKTLVNERAAAGGHFDAHVQLGERKMLTLSWTF
jgi:hypothetical protein